MSFENIEREPVVEPDGDNDVFAEYRAAQALCEGSRAAVSNLPPLTIDDSNERVSSPANAAGTVLGAAGSKFIESAAAYQAGATVAEAAAANNGSLIGIKSLTKSAIDATKRP